MTTRSLGYCGTRCPKCFAYRKSVSEAAKALRRELRTEKLKESWKEFPFLADYASFKQPLDGLAMLRCTKMCRGWRREPVVQDPALCPEAGVHRLLGVR